ncbi:MAG TPA: MG2 domain-containing protein, partial [Planctomycetota bacterium]|nr:MG2 domain-containing protein [Planctomycetota bacterium]
MWQVETDHAARGVLVLSPQGAASSEWQPGQTFAEGWQSKAHVSTDRPVYRPGQPVRYRAIYRRADGGAYRIPAKAKGRAVLVNARGAEVDRHDVVASDLGVFDGEFALDGEAPLGDWTVRIDVEDRSFSGAFRVLEYRKPEFLVAVTPEKPSYRTGDEVKAVVRLTYAFGGPVVGAPVEWEVVRVARDFTPSAVDDYSWYFQDPDALERARLAARTAPQGVAVARGTARTDDRGEAIVTFSTTERDEDAEYVVRASAVDVTRRFVVDEGRVPVVRRDHWAVVTTDRRVYRPKQEMRATVRTVDANQSPVSRSGELVLARVRRTPAPPPVTPAPRRGPVEDAKVRPVPLAEEEIEVQKVAVTTDKDGRAEVRIALPGPGIFRARWVATDARGGRVSSSAQFDVAGEAEDATKDARLVAAKETYTEGDRAEVLLQSPLTKVKALLTFEGEKVLAHRLVDVTSTSQILDVPIEGLYAPNVVLKVAIPAKDRLLEAEDEIVVFRYLKVDVTPSKAVALPGEEVGFDVRTTDAAGKPVAAEVGLTVVDDALFAVAPDQAPAIRPYFYDRKRVNRVVTSSSVGYRTYGTTRETNKDLLANAEAQSGDAEKVFAREALRIARAAMQRGDWDGAAQRALAAAAADPESWDARNLVNELRVRPEAQDALKRFDDDRRSELRKEVEAARDMPSLDAKDRLARKPGRPGAVTAAPATPAPSPAMGDMERPAEGADHNESDGDKETFEGPAKNGVIGIGGGAGGALKSRGGSRNLRGAGGGGKKADESAEGGYVTAGEATSANWKGLGAELGQAREEARRLQVLLVDAQQQARQGAQFQSQVVELQRQLGEAESRQIALQERVNKLVGQHAAFGDFAEVGAPSLRTYFADTAAWQPHVVTDAEGRASVKAILPDNLTRWRATVRGVAGESLFGEGKAFLTARRDVLIRLDAPRFLVGGDEATIPTVVHNQSAGDIDAQVKVAATGASLAGEDGAVKVPAGGRTVVDRVLSAKDPGAVRLEAEVTSAAGGDKVEAAFRTQAHGLRATDGRSGLVSTSAGDVQETFLEVPEGAVPGATRLVVALYPAYDTAILDALDFLESFPYGCVEQTVHRYLPAAWARRALAAVGTVDAKRFDTLDKTLRGAVGRLNNLQGPDGTFGWWRGGRGDVSMTALALLCYVEAMHANVPGAGDGANRTAAGLRRIVRSGADDAQALAHWALAAAGGLDVEAYQVTFRRRNEELSVAGLAWLSMAARVIGNEFDGDDLVRLLLARKVEDADTTHWTGRKDDCFVGREGLATALAVRALIEAGVADAAVDRGMRWLLAHRPQGGAGTTMEAAAFVGACAAWVERNRPAAFGGTIDVMLDGRSMRTVTVRPGGALDAKDRRFLLDVGDLKAGRHALAFKLSGEGEVRWAARLDATVAAKEIAADEHGVRVERLYLDADLPPVEGAEMPVKPGHEILRPSARPKVEAKSRDRAGTGERVLVRLTLTAPRDLQYLLVEDPLPAGFEVLEATAQGAFDWQERRDDRQVFFLSRLATGPAVLSYVIQAVHPGTFAALPTTAQA